MIPSQSMQEWHESVRERGERESKRLAAWGKRPADRLAVAQPSAANKYLARPIVVEAIQWTGDNFKAVQEFIYKDRKHDTFNVRFMDNRPYPEVGILTDRGECQVALGDYIIRGVDNSIYPCKRDLFYNIYDLLLVG